MAAVRFRLLAGDTFYMNNLLLAPDNHGGDGFEKAPSRNGRRREHAAGRPLSATSLEIDWA